MADSIVRLKVDSQEYDNKLKRASEQLNRYADGCRKAGGTLEHVDEGVLEFTRSLGKMETTANTARGKLAEMTKAFTDMSVQYKNMTEEEKKGEFGKALNASLTELKGRIQESKVQLDDVSKSLNSGGGLSGALDAVAGKFGLSIDQVTKFGGVVGVATTAVQVAKDAFFQSESGIDEWGRMVEGAKGAYSVFLDTLNNGNWSNFFQNLQTAIQGGRDLYDVFDRLGSIKSNNAAAIAITQKEIAELRLAKQQGENVDAKLKSATERLAALQKQSVSAGMAAGSQSAFQTIRNGVNSVGGAGINDATIKYAVDRIMKGGQGEFDKYKRNYQILQQKGMVTRTQTINDSQGGTYERQYKVFDINALTKEQQKQYALAKAITDGETRIQKGISAYAQAVSEGTASAREEFKGNRYALQGAGGGGGRGGSGGGKTEITYAADSITAQTKLVQDLTKQWNEASDDMRTGYLYQLIQAENKLKEMKDEQKGIREQEGARASMTTITDTMGTDLSDVLGISATIEHIQEELDKNPIVVHVEKSTKDIKAITQAAQTTAEVVGSIGQAFNSIEDPAAKVAGTVAQAIATIAAGYATATTQAASMGPWAWVAFAATGLAQMFTMINAVHSATGYAQGGIVKGNSYSGDNVPALVDGSQMVGLNAGEVVLTAAMTNNLANGIQNRGFGNLNIVGVLEGEKIKLVLNRHLKRTGQGELVTWR